MGNQIMKINYSKIFIDNSSTEEIILDQDSLVKKMNASYFQLGQLSGLI